MKLTDDQKNSVLSKLRGFAVNDCDVCNSNKWSLQDEIFEVQPLSPGRLRGRFTVATGVAPFILLVCEVCGNTKFLNVIPLGITQPKPEG